VVKCELCGYFDPDVKECELANIEAECKDFTLYEDFYDEHIDELDSGGFSLSFSDGEKPNTIEIILEYKTGDGCDRPYGDYPPDEAVISSLEEQGWDVETEGTMMYPDLMVCPKCGEVHREECEEIEADEIAPFIHKECGSQIEDYVSGNKWIRGTKTIDITKFKNLDELLDGIQAELNKVI